MKLFDFKPFPNALLVGFCYQHYRLGMARFVGEQPIQHPLYTGMAFWTKEEARDKVYELNGWKKRN